MVHFSYVAPSLSFPISLSAAQAIIVGEEDRWALFLRCSPEGERSAAQINRTAANCNSVLQWVFLLASTFFPWTSVHCNVLGRTLFAAEDFEIAFNMKI